MGADVRTEGRVIEIRPARALQAVDVDVPSDLSSAAFFLVAASIVGESELTLQQVGVNPTRDGVLTILAMMGADITRSNERLCGGEPTADLRVRGAELQAVNVGADLVPLAIDEFPILFIAAASAQGTSRFEGLAELRHKESDRIAAMTTGLAALGVRVSEGDDWVEITGGPMQAGQVDSFDDHRIAMAFCVAGAVASGAVEVLRPDNIATSFPDFARLATECGLHLAPQAA
jgi:3-phosphoshikimate 1-carboxyvinyltransferase